jgi:hypothetical protein
MTPNEDSTQFKPYEGWAVGSPHDPWIMGFDIARTRNEVKKKFEMGSGLPWRIAYRLGFRLIRVKVIQA